MCRYTLKDGRILLANHGLVDLFDFDGPPEALTGKRMGEVIQYLGEEGSLRLKLESTGEVRDYIAHFKTLKGHERWVIIDAVLLDDPVTGERIVETIGKDITATKQAERVFKAIATRTAGVVGEEFFRSLVSELATAIGTRHALVGEILPGPPKRIRTLAVFADGRLVDNLEYDLAGAPCERVVGRQLCWYPSKVQQHFPNDALLARMNVESYAGVPLFSSDHEPLGLLAVLDTEPLPESEHIKSAMLIFAERAGAELERERALEIVRESETRYRRLLGSVTDYVYTVTILDGRPASTVHGRGCEGVTGYSPEDYQSDPNLWYRMIHPEDREAVTRHANRILVESGPLTLDHRLLHKDGSIHWVRNTLVTRHDPTGVLLAYDGIVADITERKQMVLALIESEQKFRHVVESAPMGMHFYRLEDDGRLIFTGANPAADSIMGFSHELLAGKTIEAAFPGLVGGDVPERYRRIAREGISWETEEITYQDDRISAAFEVHAFQTSPGKMVAAFTNVTERKQAQAELQRLAAAVNAAEESVVITAPDGHIVYVNPCFERMTGYAKEEMMGKNVNLLKSGKHTRAFYSNLWATISVGETWTGHFMNRKKNGTLFEEKATISPVRNETGAIVNYVAVKRDVTQESLLANELRHSQKLEAIGRLAGGVAHDFTNMLVVILNSAELLKQHIATESPGWPLIDAIIDSANRSGKLSGQLLAFAHRQPMSLRAMDLNKAIRNLEDMIRRTARPDVTMTLNLLGQPLSVKMDSAQIEQVLIHMIINAQDSMPDGGRVTLETNRVLFNRVESVQLQESVHERSVLTGGFATVSISDTGVGMSEEVRRRAFDPFFTTKGAGLSTGLGLSTCYGIVKQHGGLITVYTNQGVGTTFTVYLPLTDQPPEEELETTDIDESLRGTETILVAEDNALVRKVLVNILHDLGYSVLEAEGGYQAIELAKQTSTVIHVLMTDVVMPDMTGAALADMARKLRPGIHVLFSSGYPEFHLKQHGLFAAHEMLLGKPYFRGSVARTLRRLLDHPAP